MGAVLRAVREVSEEVHAARRRPEVIGSIAVMMGYSYNTDDAGQLDKVKDFLLPLKPNVLALDSVTYKQKIAGGKAFQGSGGTATRRRREDEEAEYVVAAEGGEFWVDSYVIPVGARNPDATAHAWINFVYQPRSTLETSYTYYGSPVKRGLLRGALAAASSGTPTCSRRRASSRSSSRTASRRGRGCESASGRSSRAPRGCRPILWV